MKRWLQSEDLPSDDESVREDYFAQIHKNRSEDVESLETIRRVVQRELKKEAAGEVEKRVTKKDFAKEAARQKAKEWADSTGMIV